MRFTWTGYGDDVIDHFREKCIVFRDTRDHQEHDAKNRLLIPGPSSEKPLAEIHELKKIDLKLAERKPQRNREYNILKKFTW